MTRSNDKSLLWAFPLLGITYAAIVVLRVTLDSGQLVFGYFNLFLQLILDLTAAILAWRLYKEKNESFAPFGILAFAFLASTVTDFFYTWTLQIHGDVGFHGKREELWINIPYLLFLFLASRALIKKARQTKPSIAGLWAMAIALSAALLVFFWNPVHAKHIATQSRWIHLFCFAFQAVLFVFAVFHAVKNKDFAMRFLGIGFAVMASYGFLLQMAEIFSTLSMGLPIEVLWSGGLLSAVLGLVIAQTPERAHRLFS